MRVGVPSARTKRFITNFQAVFSLRQEDPLTSDAEGRKDVSLQLTKDELRGALETNMRRAQLTTNAEGEGVDFDDNVLKSFKLINEYWGGMTTCGVKRMAKGYTCSTPLKEVLKAARESQRNDPTKATSTADDNMSKHGEGQGSVHVQCNHSVRESIDRWWAKESTGFNEEQKHVMQHIMRRIVQEDDDTISGLGPITAPLSLLVCGGPGVGKSFVTKAAKGLFTALGWAQGNTSPCPITIALTPALYVRQGVSILCISSCSCRSD